MVRTTTEADRTEFETHDDAVGAIQSGDVEEGDTVEVEYVDVNGDDQVEHGTVTHAEVVEAGTVHGSGNRTWETSTTFYRIEYEVDGKNDHKVTGELGGDAPTVYTEVGGRHGDGGDSREMGTATGVAVEADGEDEPEHDHDGKRFTFPSWYSVQNEGAAAAPDGFPEAGLLESVDTVTVGYLSNRTGNMVEVAIDVEEVAGLAGDNTGTYWFAGNPHDRDTDRYECDFGTVTTRDTRGRLIKVGNVRYVDVPEAGVRRADGGSKKVVTDGGTVEVECETCGDTFDVAADATAVDTTFYCSSACRREAEPDVDHDPDEWCGRDECPSCQGYDEPPYAPDGGSDVDTTREACVWCGDDFPRESLREAVDGLRCDGCYHDPDAEHADADFDVEDVRHVTDDITPSIHLVTTEQEDVALCGQMVSGLRPFGDGVDTPEEAARLGAWVNVRNDDMCPACRDVFNSKFW